MLEKSAEQVLIIEDDIDTQELFQMIVQTQGYGAQVAGTGAEALKLLEDGPLPGVIFLDLTLPEMSGAEVLARLNEKPYRRSFKVVLVSGWDNLSERVRGLGADACISKPFDISQVIKTLRDVFEFDASEQRARV